MRKGLGYALVAVGVAFALLGLFFAIAAGGYEADAVRVTGLVFLGIAAAAGVLSWLVLRSGGEPDL
jgi:membrane protease YdiL (CAAX protease family)